MMHVRIFKDEWANVIQKNPFVLDLLRLLLPLILLIIGITVMAMATILL